MGNTILAKAPRRSHKFIVKIAKSEKVCTKCLEKIKIYEKYALQGFDLVHRNCSTYPNSILWGDGE